MATPIRLDKMIAHSCNIPRSQVKQLLYSGRIQVNGKTEKQGKVHIFEEDVVQLDQQTLARAQAVYLMLNKPVGYVCTHDEHTHPSVFSLLKDPSMPPLHVAGRLDADTTGLLLVTDDGQWSHQITSPNQHKWKTYRVTLAEPITPSSIEELKQGIFLNGEEKATRPAQVTVLAPQLIDLSIQEGRYHQVKRMLAAVGNHVSQLHRWQIGPLTLDETLKPGQYRQLTADEMLAIRNA
ncbi:pseudouridine synthase [Celerinatantimonas sp. YJH-8]|uniref:pseudouridine synthase n=1 Tax=Celerinatantimonas sp. YJH-8 TaxID=3228714 RepID=UPI0038BFCCEE